MSTVFSLQQLYYDLKSPYYIAYSVMISKLCLQNYATPCIQSFCICYNYYNTRYMNKMLSSQWKKSAVKNHVRWLDNRNSFCRWLILVLKLLYAHLNNNDKHHISVNTSVCVLTANCDNLPHGIIVSLERMGYFI